MSSKRLKELEEQFYELHDMREELKDELVEKTRLNFKDKVWLMYLELRIGAISQKMGNLVGSIMEYREEEEKKESIH